MNRPQRSGVPQYVNSQGNMEDQGGAGGAPDVNLKSSIYGSPPSTQYASNTSTGGAQADDTQIYEITDARTYSYHTFENTSATDPMDVYVSVIQGSNYPVAASSVHLHDALTSTAKVITIPAGKIGILKGSFYAIQVLKDGATAETPSLRFAHTVL